MQFFDNDVAGVTDNTESTGRPPTREETVEILHEAGLDTDCPCMRGQECASQTQEPYDVMRVLALSAEYADRTDDSEIKELTDASFEWLKASFNGDMDLAVNVLMYSVSRSNAFERAYRKLRSEQ